ncbi:MAG: hypothetical protein H7X95_07900 [Deltaproteobacteria bacterium]|nr:hypothetical protein [Deltaproteobacteria bacterium]
MNVFAAAGLKGFASGDPVARLCAGGEGGRAAGVRGGAIDMENLRPRIGAQLQMLRPSVV